jgi:hypothetical protein
MKLAALLGCSMVLIASVAHASHVGWIAVIDDQILRVNDAKHEFRLGSGNCAISETSTVAGTSLRTITCWTVEESEPVVVASWRIRCEGDSGKFVSTPEIKIDGHSASLSCNGGY